MMMQAFGARWILPWPQQTGRRATTAAFRLSGAALLLLTGLIHLGLASSYYAQAPYVGLLFYASGAGAWSAALLLVVGVRGAWIGGALVAAGAFIGLVLSVTVGLPGFMDSLDAPRATQSLVVEALFIGVFAVAALVRRSPLGA